MTTKAAILIPAYNAAATIVETIESIKAQSALGLQSIGKVVVADDASTDDGAALAAQAWKGCSIPLEIWPNSRNSGERTTVNTSFRRLLAEGFEVAWVLHADDVAKPHWLETMLPVMQSDSLELVSVCASWDDWYPPSKIVPGEDKPELPPVFIPGTPESASGTLRAGCWWHFSGCAMHLPRFFEVGEFRPDMPQLGDIEWLVRAALAGKSLTYIPRTLIKYRAHAGSVSSVSFRSNRDLREGLLVYRLHGAVPQLHDEARRYILRYAKMAARRAVSSALRGRWALAADCVKCLAQMAVNHSPH